MPVDPSTVAPAAPTQPADSARRASPVGERGVGTVLGAGAAVGLLFLMRKAFASESYGSPRERVPGYPTLPSGSGSPVSDRLVQRASSTRWSSVGGPRSRGAPVTCPSTRCSKWIQIESGGDMSSGEGPRGQASGSSFSPTTPGTARRWRDCARSARGARGRTPPTSHGSPTQISTWRSGPGSAKCSRRVIPFVTCSRRTA